MSPAKRTQRIRLAQRRLAEAVAVLDEVGADFRDAPGPTSVADSATWRAVVDAAGDAERARNILADTLA